MSESNENLCSGILANLFQTRILADVEFTSRSQDGHKKRIRAHKNILAASSPIFKVLFCDATDKRSEPIHIDDVCSEAFEEFIELFYGSADHLTLENAAKVMTMINKYDARGFHTMVERYLEGIVNTANVCSCLTLQQTSPIFVRRCEDIIRANPAMVIQSDNFLVSSADTVKKILTMKLELSEMDKFQALVEWAKVTVKYETLADLTATLKLACDAIRFTDMTIPQFTGIIKQFPKLLSIDVIMSIIDSISDEMKTPTSIISVPFMFTMRADDKNAGDTNAMTSIVSSVRFDVQCKKAKVSLSRFHIVLPKMADREINGCIALLNDTAYACNTSFLATNEKLDLMEFKCCLNRPISVVLNGNKANQLVVKVTFAGDGWCRGKVDCLPLPCVIVDGVKIISHYDGYNYINDMHLIIID